MYILILDIDWVFTDSLHYYTKDWKFIKAFWSNDRYVLKKIIEKWIFKEIFCLTWDSTEKGLNISKKRIEDEIWLKVVSIKKEWYKNKLNYLLGKYWSLEFIRENIIYIWDDISDIPVIKNSYWSATVVNAPRLVKKYVDYISDYRWWEWWLTDILCYLIEYLGYELEDILDVK